MKRDPFKHRRLAAAAAAPPFPFPPNVLLTSTDIATWGNPTGGTASRNKNATDYLGVANGAWTWAASSGNNTVKLVPTASGTVTHFGICGKPGVQKYMLLRIVGSGYAIFDTSTGLAATLVPTQGDFGATVQVTGNGWFYCEIQAPSSFSSSIDAFIVDSPSQTPGGAWDSTGATLLVGPATAY